MKAMAFFSFHFTLHFINEIHKPTLGKLFFFHIEIPKSTVQRKLFRRFKDGL